MIRTLFFLLLSSTTVFSQCCGDGGGVLGITANTDTFINQVLREGDVAWSSRVWKLVEANKIPHLLNTLKIRVATGDMSVYASEDFKKGLSSEQFRKMLLYHDTVFNSADSSKKEVLTKEKTISHVVIKEDYFLNKGNSKMQRKILGVGLVAETYDADGLYSGNEVLCWFYYPAIRCCLSKDSLWLHRKKSDTLITLEAFFTHHWFSSSTLQQSTVRGEILQRLKIVRGREEDRGRIENDYWED